MTSEQFYFICANALFGIFGICVGSFLNVVIYRLPNEMSLLKPSSHCPKCSYVLKWYDNIPIFSFIFLRGKCRKCKTAISPRYILVELVNGLLWLLAALRFWEMSPIYAMAAAIATSSLICIFFIDLEHFLIYNRFVILLALCGIAAIFTDGSTLPRDHIIGSLTGGGVFLVIYLGALIVLKKEGLGLGDVKYAFAAGLLLGWQKLLFATLISSIAGAIILSILRRVRNDEKQTEYPFGPFLAVGTLIALFFGNEPISWYINLVLG